MSIFDTLKRISQPGTIYIHFGKDQIPEEGVLQLQGFLRALRSRSVDLLPLNLKRQRLVQTTLNDDRLLPFPPPYSEKSASEQQELPPYCANSDSEVVEKWRLDSPPSLSENENQDRQVFPASQPLDSGTEVATPTNVSASSIVSPSPSPIRPAVFARATTRSRTHLDRIAGLERQLRGVPDHLIRRLLKGSGHSHLLTDLGDSDSDLSYESEKASFSKVQSNNCDSIRDYVDATVQRSLQSHVNEIADENCTLLYDLIRDFGEEFRSEAEEFYSGLRIETDECLRELEETCQESIDQMEERSQRCLDYIRDEGVTATEENIAKFRLSLRRYRHRRLRATRPGAPKHNRMQRYSRRRRCC
ncbi:hypothetical protein PENSUB_5177 [Penicillium subrubescens]|uniref:Uncharacterized protein n=1 Tax=Penicillium subrubescens TaxID=1316194 RepID=A0A1Q5UAH1_9EURO|nr:hypothetical protein PENSUB_5177 [Penicillium subrubescens]